MATGANNEGGSRASLLDKRSGDQPFRTSGTSTPIPDRETGTGSEYIPLQSLKPVFMIPAAQQVRGRDRVVPSDNPNEQAGQSFPDLYSDTKISRSQNGEDGEDENRGAVSERECRCSCNTMAFIDIDQLRRGTGRILLLGAPAFCGILHGKVYRHSTLSKPSWVPS